jgi:hypothetical protein
MHKFYALRHNKKIPQKPSFLRDQKGEDCYLFSLSWNTFLNFSTLGAITN